MKATLEFNLPDEDHDFRVACHGQRILSALRDVDEALRSRLKYAVLTDETSHELQEIRDILWNAVPDALEGELG